VHSTQINAVKKMTNVVQYNPLSNKILLNNQHLLDYYFTQSEISQFSDEMKHFLLYAIGIGITVNKQYSIKNKISHFLASVKDWLSLVYEAQDRHIDYSLDDKYNPDFLQEEIDEDKCENGEISYRLNYSYGN
jgi:hypothetical protein